MWIQIESVFSNFVDPDPRIPNTDTHRKKQRFGSILDPDLGIKNKQWKLLIFPTKDWKATKAHYSFWTWIYGTGIFKLARFDIQLKYTSFQWTMFVNNSADVITTIVISGRVKKIDTVQVCSVPVLFVVIFLYLRSNSRTPKITVRATVLEVQGHTGQYLLVLLLL